MAGVDTVLARKEAGARKRKDLEKHCRQRNNEKEREPSSAVLTSSSSNTASHKASEAEQMSGPSGATAEDSSTKYHVPRIGFSSGSH